MSDVAAQQPCSASSVSVMFGVPHQMQWSCLQKPTCPSSKAFGGSRQFSFWNSLAASPDLSVHKPVLMDNLSDALIVYVRRFCPGLFFTASKASMCPYLLRQPALLSLISTRLRKIWTSKPQCCGATSLSTHIQPLTPKQDFVRLLELDSTVFLHQPLSFNHQCQPIR